MKKIFIWCFIVSFTISLAGCNVLNMNKKQNDVQDKCENQCEAWSKSYQQKYPGDTISYDSHYNKKLGKCFILVKYEKSQLRSLKSLTENKVYGSFLSKKDSKTVICNVLETKCRTEDEWDSLVKPYMKE